MPTQSTCSLCDNPCYCKSLCRAHYSAQRYRARNPVPVVTADDGERWMPIPDYEGWYEASNLGRIRRIRPGHGVKVGRILHDYPRPDERRSIGLNRDRVLRTHLVHQLVCAAFHPRPDYPCEVNHIDGNPSNNRADNLEWVTKSENGLHAYRVLGRKSDNTAALAKRRKLTPQQVAEIRASTGVSQVELGRRYGVAQGTISCVILRKTHN